MIVELLNHCSDVDRWCTAFPELGTVFFPIGTVVEASSGVPCTADGQPGERTRRFAVVCNETRTAFAVIVHDWPFASNCMKLYAVTAYSEASLTALTAYLRVFLDCNSEFCCGLQLHHTSIVHPTAQVSVPAVFRSFSDVANPEGVDH